ncbi:MAG: formylglycine-generating enzyme family protein [Treponema sp.]|nr:formylglycine-generating enzyme family protein [Treponema sp.]
MKKIKNQCLIGLIILIGVSVIDCDNGNTPLHIHTYSTTWTSNAALHWKECTGAGCDAKTGTANHAPVNGVCTTCGYDNTPVNMEMVTIPAGTFTKGTVSGGYDDERPVRQVTLSAFKMGKYEVTQEQYQEVMGINPSYFYSNPAAGEVQRKRPVEYVTWFDAIEFCNKLSTKEGLTPVYTITGRTPATGYPITSATVTTNWSNNGYRLPTEAQWEYACRAGSTTDWYFGNTVAELINYAWYNVNANSMTHQVGKKTANAWGLYDMHGNVWEWCWDWYGSSYYGESGNTNNPMGPSSGTYRVDRGGGWVASAEGTRSAYRGYGTPGDGFNLIGFRVVRP